MTFLEIMTTKQIRLLMQEMSISKKENVEDLPFSIVNGVLHITHGYNDGRVIESIYKEFEVIKLYNSSPSNYDQKRYQNFMAILLEKDKYREALTAAQEAAEKRATESESSVTPPRPPISIAVQDSMDELPYFISRENTSCWSGGQIAAIKENHNYLYRAFNHLYSSIKRGSLIGGAFRALLLSGRLPKNDDETGIDTLKLAKRLRSLVMRLSDDRHPENLENFKKSFFYNTVLIPIVFGNSMANPATWTAYKRVYDCEAELADKKGYDGALYCWKHDRRAPVGINLSRIIMHALPPTGAPDEYEVNGEVSINIEMEIGDAIQKQLDLFKTNRRFLRNYTDAD